MNFKELHDQKKPMLICNVWDVQSAQAAQKLNFKAIGTSSGAIAYLEAGYSRNPAKVAEYILRLGALGVVGVNIEDSLVEGERRILDADAFPKTLEAICSILARENQELFINVRTDTFLLGLPNAIQETIARAQKYHNAGGQGIFVPCIEKEQDINAVIQEIDLPLNVMCMPKLPDFSTLERLGVKRISMGNFVFNKLNYILENTLSTIAQNNSFQNLFA